MTDRPTADRGASGGESRKPALHRAALWLCSGMFAFAAIVTGYLGWAALSRGTVAGCGLDSPCDRVLQSQWAYWFGIPVSLPAFAIYLVLLGISLGRIAGWRVPTHRLNVTIAATLAFVVITAAIWFTVLQAFVIRGFCLYCLSAHIAGVAGSALLLVDMWADPIVAQNRDRSNRARAILAALIGISLLIGGQYARVPPPNRINSIGVPSVQSNAAGSPRMLALHEGRFQLDLDAAPKIGPSNAPRVVVSLFDYTCAHCRRLDELIGRALKESEDNLVVMTLPVPLDAACNSLVKQTSAENVGACEYARLALAVWKAKPDAFAKFHGWLFAPPRPPPIEEARRYAEELAGANALQQALLGDSIARQLRAHFQLFEINSRRSDAWQLPQLIVGKNLSVGPVNSPAALRQLLEEQFGPMAPF